MTGCRVSAAAIERVGRVSGLDDQRLRHVPGDGEIYGYGDLNAIHLDMRSPGSRRFRSAGWVTWALNEDGDVVLGLVWVNPAKRSRGVGTALVRAVLEEGSRRGVSVVLTIGEPEADGLSDSQLRSWYRRVGFDDCGGMFVHDGRPRVVAARCAKEIR